MAADKHRNRGRRAANRRRLAVVGLIAFAAVDALLIAAVVAQRAPSTDESAPAPMPATSSPAAETETPEPIPTSTPAPDVAGTVPSRLLSVVDETTAWRTLSGSCPSPGATAALERTTDGGITWTPSTVTTEASLTSADRLQAIDPSTAFVVGAGGSECTQAFSQTFSGGQSYVDYPDQLGSTWYVAATDRATVHSPTGSYAAPCAVVTTLAVTNDEQAAVLCGDGTLSTTTDAGTTWATPTAVPGAVSVTAGTGGYLLARLGQEGCEAVSVASYAPGAAEAGPVGCAPGDASVPEDVVLAATGGAVWLWAGEDVLVSTDRGASW